MIPEIMKKVFLTMKTKMFKEGELDIRSPKFNTGKFLIATIMSALTGLVLYEGYLVNKLAYKYRNLDFMYKKSLEKIDELERKEKILMHDCQTVMKKFVNNYRHIDKCLHEQELELNPQHKDK